MTQPKMRLIRTWSMKEKLSTLPVAWDGKIVLTDSPVG